MHWFRSTFVDVIQQCRWYFGSIYTKLPTIKRETKFLTKLYRMHFAFFLLTLRACSVAYSLNVWFVSERLNSGREVELFKVYYYSNFLILLWTRSQILWTSQHYCIYLYRTTSHRTWLATRPRKPTWPSSDCCAVTCPRKCSPSRRSSTEPTTPVCTTACWRSTTEWGFTIARRQAASGPAATTYCRYYTRFYGRYSASRSIN